MPRLTLELNEEAYTLLEEMRRNTGKTKAELIRQGIVLRHFAEEQRHNGRSLCISNGGSIEKEILLS